MKITIQPPKTILLSGAPGTGKSTLQRRAPAFFRPHWGDTAALGTDEMWQMFDPDWSLPYDCRWAALVQSNCCRLAKHFFEAGFGCVVIAGNALYTLADLQAYQQELAAISQVYHFTLDADDATLIERVRQRGDLDAHPPAWLAEWQAHIRSHYADWTQVIDTTQLTVKQTLEQILASASCKDRAM